MDKNVTVIVVCYNEKHYIADCLFSLVKQKYNESKVEIIVVDGSSNDGSIEVIKKFMLQHSNIKLIANVNNTIPSNRNIGLNNAAHGLVVFLDADCIAPDNWLEILVKNCISFRERDEKTAGIGGGNIRHFNKKSKFNTSLDLTLDTFLGGFGTVLNRRLRNQKLVYNLPCLNALYDKSILFSAGGFDGTLMMAEDADLNYRLIKNGHHLWYIPESFVWHSINFTLFSWTRKMFFYGYWRGRLLRKHKSLMDIRYFLPLIFIIFFFIILFIPKNFLLSFTFIYLGSISLQSVFLGIVHKTIYKIPIFLAIYIFQHFSYAVGQLCGIFLTMHKR